MGSSGREALTSLAVMKKFHGSSVPRPRIKKISQTALYLRRGQRGLEWNAGQSRGQASLLTVLDAAARSTREEEIYCPVSAPAAQLLLVWAAGGHVALQRGHGRPSLGEYEDGSWLAASQHMAPKHTAAIARAGRERGLVPAWGTVYSLFAMEKLTERVPQGRDSLAAQ